MRSSPLTFPLRYTPGVRNLFMKNSAGRILGYASNKNALFTTEITENFFSICNFSVSSVGSVVSFVRNSLTITPIVITPEYPSPHSHAHPSNGNPDPENDTSTLCGQIPEDAKSSHVDHAHVPDPGSH